MRKSVVVRIVAVAVACVALLLVHCADMATRQAPVLPVITTGTRDGAAYRVDIPANWNHELIVYYHGYRREPGAYEKDKPLWPALGGLLAKGYALIQSGYSRGGWAIEQAYAETEAVRREFVATYGQPVRSWVMGESMGGALTAFTIETRPEIYNGALALCGAVGPSNRILDKAFAMRAAFDYYFPDVLGPLVPVPEALPDFDDMKKRIADALAARPDARDAMLRLYGPVSEKSFPGTLAVITQILGELQRRTQGNPFGNADLIYTGSGDDFALNDGVKRYRADAPAAAYVARWYTPTGKLQRPLLALHDTIDPLVPAGDAFEYALIAQRAGHGENFVQQYINREGHCVFEPDEIARAFDELVDWAGTGKRPLPGRLR